MDRKAKKIHFENLQKEKIKSAKKKKKEEAQAQAKAETPQDAQPPQAAG